MERRSAVSGGPRDGPLAACATQGVLHDASYRRALGPAAWARLDAAVRRRFSIQPGPHVPIVFRGVLETVRLSRAGWLFAQACRLLGRPLATMTGRNVPLEVRLSDDARLGGVCWRRLYRFRGGANCTVVSTKCWLGGDRFVEHVGRGFHMELCLAERAGGLVFTSTAYRLAVFGLQVTIPAWLTPGTTTVTHEPLDARRFRFTLSVDHPLLGNTVFQSGVFQLADRSL